MSIRIDWSKLKMLPDAECQTFEKFCFHIAICKFGSYGTVKYFYNTPGSEFYIELNKELEYAGVYYHKGDVIGWQAKYWLGVKTSENSPLDKGHIDELESGFKTTLKRNPNTKLWIICTPGSVIEDQWIKLTKTLSAEKSDCQFESWHKDCFEGFYTANIQKYNGIFNYFFGEQYLGINRLHEITEATISNMKKKYDVDLHTPSDFESRLISIVDTNKAEKLIRDKVKQITEHINNDKKKPIFDRIWGNVDLTNKIEELITSDFDDKYDLSEKLTEVTYGAKDLHELVMKIAPLLESYKERHKERLGAINKGIKDIRDKNRYDFYFIDQLVSRVNILNRLLWHSDKNKSESLEQLLQLAINKDYSVFAEAGYGKTHFACSLAQYMIEHRLPVLLITGGKFRNSTSPEQKIIEILGLSQNRTFDDALDILNLIGENYNCKLPIIIDGLNESTPTIEVWQDNLLSLRRKIIQRKNLLIVTTCREKSEYIQVIYGVNSYTEVENNIRLHGFVEKNINQATKRYFKKYNIRPINEATHVNFSNPLLLKIFCIVNKGRYGFELNEHVLASCMEEYNNRLISSLSLVNGAENRLNKITIQKGLSKIAFEIWNRNDREFDYETIFYEAFGNLSERVLDEGLCFATDKDNNGYSVKFTYDMVAGYHIAKALLDKIGPDASKFIEIFKSTDYTTLLFAPDVKRHTLSEDICKSLFYLIPKRYGQEWFTLMPNVNVFSSALNNIDIILATQEGRQAMLKLLQEHGSNVEFKRTLCDNLFSRAIDKRNIEYLSLFKSYYISFTAVEWDLCWNYRFEHYHVLDKAYGILHDKFFAARFKNDDKAFFALMMCGITDMEFRQKFTRYLFGLINSDRELLYTAIDHTISVKDPFIFEVVISIITGIALRTNKTKIIDYCIGVLESYMISYTSNHVVLLDNLETLYSYNEYLTGREGNRTLLYQNYEEIWQEVDDNPFSIHDICDYDYEKFHVRPLSNMNYDSKSPYTIDRVYKMLYFKIPLSGSDITSYNQIQENENNAVPYRREQKCNYLHKFGRHAIMELTGWMILHQYINSEYKTTFRDGIIDIDPTFPEFKLRSLVTHSYMPRTINDLPKWINKNYLIDMQSYFIQSLPNQQGEWILISGCISQNIDERFANFHMSGISEIFSKSISKEYLDNLRVSLPTRHNHIVAGEISWRDLEFTESEMEEEMLNLLCLYSFKEWSQSRFSHQSFLYLNPKISQAFDLDFNIAEMGYFNKRNEQVSVYFHNGNEHFFYLRRDIIEEILIKYNAKLRFHMYQRNMTTHNLPPTAPTMRTKFQEFKNNIYYELK